MKINNLQKKHGQKPLQLVVKFTIDREHPAAPEYLDELGMTLEEYLQLHQEGRAWIAGAVGELKRVQKNSEHGLVFSEAHFTGAGRRDLLAWRHHRARANKIVTGG